MNKKKFIYDVLLNITSSSIPIVILQLFILPYVASRICSNSYGLVITFVSILNIVPATFGNTLNNIRLIYNLEYEEKRYLGDFNIILLEVSLLNIIVLIFIISYYDGSFNVINILLIVFASIVLLGNNYFIVFFRLKLNFKLILLNNIILSIGYLIGTCFYVLTNLWQFIFIFGYLFNLAFIFTVTDIWREPFKKTPFFTRMCKETILLLFANVLKRSMNYADKLIIYSLMGGASVSIYYSATILSKIISLIITPINGVVISYLSKLKSKPVNLFRYTLTGGIIFSTIGYFIIIFISRPVLAIIYPQYLEKAIQYIYVTSAATVIMVLNSIVLPFVMKFCMMKWQTVINGSTLIIYLTMSLFLYNAYGLMGFCISLLISRLINFAIMLIIYIFTSKN